MLCKCQKGVGPIEDKSLKDIVVPVLVETHPRWILDLFAVKIGGKHDHQSIPIIYSINITRFLGSY